MDKAEQIMKLGMDLCPDGLFCDLNSSPTCRNKGIAYVFVKDEDPEGGESAIACFKHAIKLHEEGKC
jgi:hypothetical protein